MYWRDKLMLLELRLKQIRFKQQKQFNVSNLYLYKSITTYIQNSELRSIEKEEILQQVMDMMIQVQIEDKPMNLIIGQDYEEFCKSIIEEYSRGESKIYTVLNYIQKSLLGMVLYSALLMILRGVVSSSFNLGITVDYLIMVSVISLIMLPGIKKSNQEKSSLTFCQKFYMFNNGVTKSGANAFILMIFIVGLLRFVLGKILGTKVFNYTITLNSSIPYVLLIILIIFVIEGYKRMDNKGRK